MAALLPVPDQSWLPGAEQGGALTPNGQSEALLDATDLLDPGVLGGGGPCLQQKFAHGVLALMPHFEGAVIPLHLVVQVDAAELGGVGEECHQATQSL